MRSWLISRNSKDLVETTDAPSLHTLARRLQMTQNRVQKGRVKGRRLRKASPVLVPSYSFRISANTPNHRRRGLQHSPQEGEPTFSVTLKLDPDSYSLAWITSSHSEETKEGKDYR